MIYKLDPTLVADPIFNTQCKGGLYFNTYHNEAELHLIVTPTLAAIVCIKPKATLERYIPIKFIGIPQKDFDIYTLQYLGMNTLFNMTYHRIFPHNPYATPSNILKDKDNTLLG